MTEALKNEINSCLVAFTPDGTGSAAQTEWIFPRGFTGFQGHFPGHPVCPGVCIIAAQLVAAERLAGATLELVEMENVKFMWPVFPDRPVRGRVKVEPVDGGCWRVQADLERGKRRIAKFLLLTKSVNDLTTNLTNIHEQDNNKNVLDGSCGSWLKKEGGSL